MYPNFRMVVALIAIVLHAVPGTGQDAAQAFPADCYYLLSVPDVKAIERDIARGPGELWQETEVRAWWRSFCELKAPGLAVNPECFGEGRIETFFAGMDSLAVGMYLFHDRPHVAAVVGTSMDRSSFNRLISAVFFELINVPIPVPVFTQNHQGRTYCHLLSLLFWTFVDGKVVIGDDPGAMESIASNLPAQSGSIRELKAFKTLTSRAGPEYRALLFVNVERVLSSFKNVPAEISELEQVKTLAVASIPSAGGAYDFVYLEAPGARGGWLRLFARGGVSLDLLKLIPDDSVAVAALPLDLPWIWEKLGTAFRARLGPGDDFYDVFSCLGEEGVIFATCQGALPDVFLALRVRDRKRMEKAIAAFIDTHNARALPVSRYEFEHLRQEMAQVRAFLNREGGTPALTQDLLPALLTDPWGQPLYLTPEQKIASLGPDGIKSADDIDEAALASAPTSRVKRSAEQCHGRELCTLEFCRVPGTEDPGLREILAMAPTSYVFLGDHLILSQRMSIMRYLAQSEAKSDWTSRFFPGSCPEGGFVFMDLAKVLGLFSQAAFPFFEYRRRKEMPGEHALPALPPGEKLSRHFRQASVFYRADGESISITLSLPVSFSHLFAPVVLSRLCHAALAEWKGYGVDKEVEVMHKLGAIFQAQMEFRTQKSLDQDQDGQGEFALLPELSGEGRMRGGKPSRLYLAKGHSWDEAIMISRGYCYIVYLPGSRENLPPDVDAQEGRFICYAWPYLASERQQRVFAITQEGEIWVAPNKKAKYLGNARVPAPEAAFAKIGKEPSRLDAPMGGRTCDREPWARMYRPGY